MKTGVDGGSAGVGWVRLVVVWCGASAPLSFFTARMLGVADRLDLMVERVSDAA